MKSSWKGCAESAGIVSETSRGLIEVRGKDRGTFLQGLFSQDLVRSFPLGKAVYGLFPNVKGRILADAFAVHLEGGRFVLDVEASAVELLLEHLDRYLVLMEAEVRDLSPKHACLILLGPRVPDLLEHALGVRPLAKNQSVVLEGIKGFAFHAERPRFEEYRLWASREEAVVFQDRLQAGGGELIDLETYHAVLLEHGVPRLGTEMGEETFPQELGLEELLNFQKGCFLGAEVLQRIHYQGHVNWTLTLFQVEGQDPPRPGAKIVQDGREAGRVTQSAFSHRFGAPVALGMVRTALLGQPGTFLATEDGREIPLRPLQVFQASKA